MKRLLFITISIMITLGAFSQTENSEHLKFKGIPIDGTLNSFVQKLKGKGYSYIGAQQGVAMFSGEFASYKSCTIGVVSNKEKDLVCKIAVIFPAHDTWSPLYTNYSSLKEMLTQKYGEPIDYIEEFQYYHTPDDDNTKMFCVMTDRCKYATVFRSPKGDIQISISKGEYSNGFVLLEYFDKINSNIVINNAIDDL